MLCLLTSIPHLHLHASSTRHHSRENCDCKMIMSDTQSPRLSWDLELGSSPRILQLGCAQIWISSSPPICRRSAPSSRQTFDPVPQSKCGPLHGARGSTPTPYQKSSVSFLRIVRHDVLRISSAATSYVPAPETVWSCGRRILLLRQVYFPELLAPLLRSLLHLTSPPLVNPSDAIPPTVVISYKIRSLAKETPLWSAFGLWFEFAPVLVKRKQATSGDPHPDATVEWTRFSPGDADDETFVFVATRRPESLSWTIPDEDHALMTGAGAYGSASAKSDEQFEQLLLMGMDP